MRTAQTLLDECVILCGSQAALGSRLGSTQQDVHKWSTGKRPISPATVGQLCDLLKLDGVEAQRLAAEAVIATAKPEKQGVLRRAFFALSATGVAYGEALMTVTGDSVTTGLQVASASIEATMYRVSTWLRHVARGASTRDHQTCGPIPVGLRSPPTGTPLNTAFQ